MIGSSSFSSPPSLSPCAPKKSSKCAAYAPQQPQRLDILEKVFKNGEEHQLLSSDDTAALKHFVTSFIWVDILSHASGLQNPKHPTSQAFDYLPLLEDSTLDLSHVMGCENWVFISLARIIFLEHALRRRRRDPSSRTPDDNSFPDALDPYSQAVVLEADLEQRIRGLLEARCAVATNQTQTQTELDLKLHSSLVTELFALAAITFLHTTVFGANPRLPPIKANVARTMTVLAALPMHLLIRVSWPFTVTGCMALEQDEEGQGQSQAVKEVLDRAHRAGLNTGTVLKGMFVVEECWRLRRLTGVAVGVSWVDAMKSLGEKILLC